MMRKRLFIPVTFILLLTLIVGIVIYFSNNSHNRNILRSLGYTTSISNSWYVMNDSEQIKVNTRRIGYYVDRETGELSLYCKIPASASLQSNTLALRSSHIAFDVYLNDEPYYTYGTYNSITGVSKAPPATWHFIEIPPQAAGSVLRMEIKSFYLDGTETITDSYYGKSAVILRDIILKNMFPFGICALLVLFGFMFMLLHIIANNVLKIGTHMLYMGMFIMLMATWSMMHTAIPMFFVEDTTMLDLLGHLLVMCAPLTLLLHIERTCEIKHRLLYSVAYAAVIINSVAQLILWRIGIYDFHMMQDKTHMVMTYSCIIMFITVLEAHKAHKEIRGEALFYDSLQIFAYGVFFASVVIDIARLYISVSTDDSFMVRIALILLTVTVGIKSLLDAGAFARENYVSSMVRSLAYKDTLTNLGNRTSFTETLGEIELSKREHKTLSVFVFDVNYLKYINDTFGHQQGDKLITSCAECIRNVFEADCRLFRIGGDEFAAIYAGSLSGDILREKINVFSEAIARYNLENPGPFSLRVAVGVAFMNSSRNETMEELFKRADRIMYENKRAMKEADNEI